MNIWDFKQIHKVIQAPIMILDTGDYDTAYKEYVSLCTVDVQLIKSKSTYK